MKNFLTAILLGLCLAGSSQSFRNEWIDYSKTYYKFKIASTGLYRISQSQLAGIGIAGGNAQDFKLWRNGVEIPVYTSVASGTLGGSDYIEFWGIKNDGKADTELYPDAFYQCSDKNSLFTDTACYFLTISPGSNARLTGTVNDTTGHGAPENYCIYDLGFAWGGPASGIWGGTASYIQNEYVRSSTFDRGEGFQSSPFSSLSIPIGSLKAYTAGPAMNFRSTGAGSFIGYRLDSLRLNDSVVSIIGVSQFDNYVFNVANIPLSRVRNDSITIKYNTSDQVSQYGQVMIAEYSLTYPRRYDFGGNSNLSFRIPANAAGSYLEISNFNDGGADPVLYDLTNNRRYTCFRVGGLLKVKLLPSAITRNCILINAAASSVRNVGGFTTRNFINYAQAANQGDYIIIASNLLNSGSNNQVEAYRAYRASAAGGSFNAQTFNVDEIADQFGYGIRKHPIGIRNFLRYARTNFTSTPKFVLLIGRGVNYNEYYNNQTQPNAEWLNQVPGWGEPASDNLLSSNSVTVPVPATPIGRLSVISNAEIKAYLDKVKAFELQQASTSYNQLNKDWTKQVLHLIGASDAYTGALIQPLMDNYKAIIRDTLMGADVHSYIKANNPNLTQSTAEVAGLINNGVSLLTYFGHSSSTSLDFNLNNPNDYTNNNGKYPVFIANGCNAGNFFTYDENRYTNNALSISEKFVLAPDRGSIAFIASTHFGVVNTLDYVTREWYNAAGKTRFGKSIGEIHQKALDSTWKIYNGDYHTRLTLEETTIHGDPAVKLFAQTKPDYSLESSNIIFNPGFISATDDSFNVKVYLYNLGKAISDSVSVKIDRQFPNGDIKQLALVRLKGILHKDSVSLNIPIIGNREQGTNYIIATIDPANQRDELSESNNSTSKAFQISADEIRPVYPYSLSIVAKTTVKFYGSTADPLQASRAYRMQVDTTEKFDSPLMVSQDVTSSGGLIAFNPTISFTDGRVYYWRLAPLVNAVPVNWRAASFLYNPSGTAGWSQSHLYQHFKSTTEKIFLDSASRAFKFSNRINNMFIVHSKFPESGTEDNHFSISINGDLKIWSACTGASVIFNVFDTTGFNSWRNYPGGLYGSGMNNCGDKREFNFEFPYNSPASRKLAMDFMNLIPNGYYVAARLILDPTNDPVYGYGYNQSFANTWKADTSIYGSGQSLYHYLFNQGAKNLDSINVAGGRIWSFVYRKNDSRDFQPRFAFSNTIFDRITESIDCPTLDTIGYINSPKFGPAKSWQGVHWSGHSQETNNSTDSVRLFVIGINNSGAETVLYMLDKNQQDFDISSVNAAAYPYIKLRLFNQDATNGTPWQLDYWRLNYVPVPEGALAPTLYYVGADSSSFDPVTQSSKYQFGVAFSNISDAGFDSIRLAVKLTDKLGNVKQLVLPKIKPIISGDTARVYFVFNADTLSGNYNLSLDVNPNNDQPEQFHFNNYMFKSVTIYRPDNSGVCPGMIKTLYSGSSAPGNTYQWQVNTGTGFVNIGNSSIYTGTNADSLKLNKPPTSWYGYLYRCMITNGGNTSYSPEFALKFAVNWTGSVSDAWENSANWGCGILPDEFTDVYITAGAPNYPVVSSNTGCRSLRVTPNTSVNVKAGFKLDVQGR